MTKHVIKFVKQACFTNMITYLVVVDTVREMESMMFEHDYKRGVLDVNAVNNKKNILDDTFAVSLKSSVVCPS